MNSLSSSPDARRMRWVFWLSLSLAAAGVFVFPFHVKSFVLALVGGAVYAMPSVFRSSSRGSAVAGRFLAGGVAGAVCLTAARIFPKAEPYSSYYVFAAFAIAAAIGSGVALIMHAANKKV